MTTTKRENRVFTAGSPREDDRCTVILTVHYQEYDSPITQCRWAYDELLPADDYKPFQTSIRVNPGERKTIPIGDLTWGKTKLALGHNNVRISSGNDNSELLLEAQKSNIIRITDSDGKLVAEMMPTEVTFGKLAGPLFAEATTTTALLHITACPTK